MSQEARNRVVAVAGKRRPPAAGKGRKKGVPNKTTALLKDAILKAADQAGGKDGLVGYLTQQARTNPGPFMALLGKVLPMQVTGEGGGPIQTTVQIVQRRIIRPEQQD